MKRRLAIALVLIAGLLLLGLDVTARGPAQSRVAALSFDPPLTLRLNLGSDPLTLDPAMWQDTTSAAVIEQLFLGLVDLDDDTSEVRPELATSWDVSPDGTVYTFTLRSGVTWSDGHPLTAEDCRYGILRSLDPATAAPFAYNLLLIKNAEAYNAGIITQDQVGVRALDSTHLEITLEYPASYILSVLSTPCARPMPRWAIEAWGGSWAKPGHIVTNGPYTLAEWVPGHHIRLDKRPGYYDAADVQIEQVQMFMVNDATAWTMYLNGELDTANVPAGAELDDALRAQVHSQPIGCTYYYGFSVSQPPLDNVLVRKALVAAVDRQGLIATVVGGAQRPALTFVAPGIFGYVDGEAEGVGIPYDPVQARQWLADAGYPNGVGLPPITIWFNTSTAHQAIAQYIHDNWEGNLHAQVTLASADWGQYLQDIDNGDYPVFRMGWCMDYPDASNFYNGLSRGALGGWNNATFEDLVRQAAREQDAALRQALYRQAEEILVETDAVVLPLYYYASNIAARAYLQRTYAVSSYDIASWRFVGEPLHFSLAAGWNLISLPLVPPDTSPPAVLSSIAGKYDLVYGLDATGAWQRYSPAGSGNSLTTMVPGNGYWVHTTQAVTLTVYGLPPEDGSIPLSAGWNLVGYPGDEARPVADALATIVGKYDLVYAYDLTHTGEPWLKHNPAPPPPLNDLTEMRPGRGYWIHATEACTWSVP